MPNLSPATEDSARPQLNRDQWREVFVRMDDLLDARDGALPPATAGSDDGAVQNVLRDYCERMAGSAETTKSFVVAASISNSLFDTTRLTAGQRCGNYRLIEPIGQGGMGSVWRAQRVDGLYQSEVAVKLLGSLALSGHARARFAREGELLARLAHPHIARLLDAGVTDDHQRFLVLELVSGQDIAAFAQSTALNQQALLVLFRQVLSAVAFAHSQLVVHRDIKPSNVMVTREGQVKLLDFGVAKLIDSEAVSEESVGDLTHVVGAAYTEAYAAPEQLRGDGVGTAADVFSLGTLLFVLLSGAAPQWRLPKRELKAGALPDLTATFQAKLDKDLRAILLKAVAIAPEERYATVAAFDDDVARYLKGETVRAQPVTRRYQLQKFLQRHRGPVLAGALAAVAIVASLGVALWQLHETRIQRAQALTEARRANEVTAFLTDIFRGVDLRMASSQDKRTLTAMQLLEAGRVRLNNELDDQPETKVALLGVLAEVYGVMGEGAQFEAINNQRIQYASQRFGPMHPAVLSARLTDAEADLYSGNFDAARQSLAALDPIFLRVFGEKSERYAYLLAARADLERRAGVVPIGSVLEGFERALAIQRGLGSKTEDHAVTLQNYSTALASSDRLAESLAVGAEAIGLLERTKGADLGGLAIAYGRRAQTLQLLGRHADVEPEYDKSLAALEKSYGTDSTLFLNALLAKASWLHRQSRRAEAWGLVTRVFSTTRRPSSDTLGLPEQYFVRGGMLLDEGRFPEAVSDLTRAVQDWASANNNPSRLARARSLLERAIADANAAKVNLPQQSSASQLIRQK